MQFSIMYRNKLVRWSSQHWENLVRITYLISSNLIPSELAELDSVYAYSSVQFRWDEMRWGEWWKHSFTLQDTAAYLGVPDACPWKILKISSIKTDKFQISYSEATFSRQRVIPKHLHLNFLNLTPSVVKYLKYKYLKYVFKIHCMYLYFVFWLLRCQYLR